MIWLTSDTHFGHDREFIYVPRGFSSVQEQDKEIIKRWNSVVSKDDIIYHLGDVMLNDNEHGLECLCKLNGTIFIIPGNHDTTKRIELYRTLPNVEVCGFAERLSYKKYNFYLSHYPTMTSNLEGSPHLKEHIINLFAHTHQNKNFYNDIPFMYHVGLDSHDCFPVSIDTAIEDMIKETKKCFSMVEQKKLIPSYEQRCRKCVYTKSECGCSDQYGDCKKYKRDPPDGGYYG